MQLSRHAARALALAAQGLLQPAGTGATKDDLLATIRRMGALQIDTIHVIARSPYFVLWSRLGAYPLCWLDELLAEGAIFEGWSHAACFLPTEDYGLYRRRMLERAARSRAWFEAHADLAGTMLAHIREHGSVRAADWSRTDGRVGTWWDWKPEKQALEYLLEHGDLMVARRTATFERVYDLRERVLPGWDDRNTPTREEMYRTLALKAVRALGVAIPQWIPDYFRTSKRETIAHLAALAREGALLPVQIEGLPDAAYVHPDHRATAEAAADGALHTERTTFLSPFDPIVWDRARAQALWGFGYRIETYTPAAARRYGYFSLPILHRGALVGRLDPKAHRKQGIFEIRALHLEEGVEGTGELCAALAEALQACARWHGTPEVQIRSSNPPEVAEQIRAVLRQAPSSPT